MNVNWYKSFIAIAETGSFTQAANKLLVAQPALTQQIKKMEDEVGCQLLTRHTRKVELTEEGRIFLKFASDIVKLEENMFEELSNTVKYGGFIRLGMTTFMPSLNFDKLMKMFYDLYPQTFVELSEFSGNEVLANVKSGILDLGIVTHAEELPVGFHILDETVTNLSIFACSPKNSLYLKNRETGEAIGIEEIRGLPVCTTKSIRDYLFSFAKKKNFEPNLRALGDSKQSTLDLAKSGGMIAVITMMPHETEGLDAEMDYYPISTQTLNIKTYLLTAENRELTVSVRRFVDIYKKSLQS